VSTVVLLLHGDFKEKEDLMGFEKTSYVHVFNLDVLSTFNEVINCTIVDPSPFKGVKSPKQLIQLIHPNY